MELSMIMLFKCSQINGSNTYKHLKNFIGFKKMSMYRYMFADSNETFLMYDLSLCQLLLSIPKK